MSAIDFDTTAAMSAFGPKQTWASAPHLSAYLELQREKAIKIIRQYIVESAN
jgi:hypothetical protein